MAKSELVDCMLEQMAEMEDNIRRAKRGDFKVSLHSMEVRFIRKTSFSFSKESWEPFC